MLHPKTSQNNESAEKTVLLITPRTLLFIAGVTFVYFLVFYNMFNWSLQRLGIYVLYITCCVGVVYVIQFSPWAQWHLSVMEEDTKTIQSHWDNDSDLRIITIVTRSLYALSFLSWIASIFLCVNVSADEITLVMSGLMEPDVEKWFWDNTFVFAWKMYGFGIVLLPLLGSALFILSAIIEFVAGVHIIFFRK